MKSSKARWYRDDLKKSCLVVGSEGFVGRHLCPLLEVNGYEVLHCNNPSFEILSKEKIFLDYFPVDVVIHLGANIQDISEREKGDIEKYRDIGLDLEVMRFVGKYPPAECFIYPSSCSVDSADTDPYAYSKAVGERMCQALHKQGVPVVILRPFSGYGPDQAESYPFPAILSRAMRREDPLTVWGSGTQVRDWIHVDDLASAFVWAIKDAPRGFPVEIGTGIGTGLNSLAIQIASRVCCERTEGPVYNPVVFGDESKPSSSMKRVAKTLVASKNGFNCQVNLEEGIMRAVKERMGK